MNRRTSIAAIPALVGGPAFFWRSATSPVTEAEAKAIFYALLEERTAAVEKGIYSKIEPLYSHDENLVVFRPDLVLRGWKATEAFWQRSLSRTRSDFHVYWNDDLAVTVEGEVIVGALTWSNQSGDNPRRYGCLTLTLRRRDDRWLIVQEHSSNWTKPPSTGP
jgi:ketosteroid isomerase-like protein